VDGRPVAARVRARVHRAAPQPPGLAPRPVAARRRPARDRSHRAGRVAAPRRREHARRRLARRQPPLSGRAPRRSRRRLVIAVQRRARRRRVHDATRGVDARARQRHAERPTIGTSLAHDHRGRRVPARVRTRAPIMTTLDPNLRRSGVLLHPTSLPGPHGLGDLGPGAYHFVDWLVTAGQRAWQVLPLNPIGPGNSPYASVSVFAGSPLLVALEPLIDAGWLERPSADELSMFDAHRIDYAQVIPWRM